MQLVLIIDNPVPNERSHVQLINETGEIIISEDTYTESYTAELRAGIQGTDLVRARDKTTATVENLMDSLAHTLKRLSVIQELIIEEETARTRELLFSPEYELAKNGIPAPECSKRGPM